MGKGEASGNSGGRIEQGEGMGEGGDGRGGGKGERRGRGRKGRVGEGVGGGKERRRRIEEGVNGGFSEAIGGERESGGGKMRKKAKERRNWPRFRASDDDLERRKRRYRRKRGRRGKGFKMMNQRSQNRGNKFTKFNTIIGNERKKKRGRKESRSRAKLEASTRRKTTKDIADKNIKGDMGHLDVVHWSLLLATFEKHEKHSSKNKYKKTNLKRKQIFPTQKGR